MNLEQARSNMINQQIRSWEVVDSHVLDILREIPREEFVPTRHRKIAFSDLRIPLGHGQLMMKPIEQGRLLQGLALAEGEKVLEIGTGSGFLTACLAKIDGQRDQHRDPRRHRGTGKSQSRGARHRRRQLRTGDVLEAGFDDGEFDAIAVTASVASIPDQFVRWLRAGGRLFIVRGQAPAMEALVVTRNDSGRLSEQSLFETDLPRLIGAEDAPVFNF